MTTERARAQRVFERRLLDVHVETDRVFFWLLIAQWGLALALAVLISPFSWEGSANAVHLHVKLALTGGACINSLPLLLIRKRPGWWFTRHSVAVAQMLWSALLIHLTGGRIETHFHVFGSLAFVAFYRDWRVLGTATVVVATDHLVRGLVYPESVYGIANPEWWRFLEHAGWVVFEDIVLVLACTRALRELRVIAERQVELEETKEQIELEVQERTSELRRSTARYRALVENANAIPFEYERGDIVYIAPQAAHLFGCTEDALLDRAFLWSLVVAEDRQRVRDHLATAAQPGAGGSHFDLKLKRPDGRQVEMRVMVSSAVDGQPLRAIALDVTQQRKLEAELSQAQKLESVGRLASGVAHEINTPVQFVNDSVHFLRGATSDLFEVVDTLQGVRDAVREGKPANDLYVAATRAEENADLDYLRESMPEALERSLDGLERVAKIVRSMKEFAHPDSTEAVDVDLNRAIESTLTIARNEYKYVAELVTDYNPLPRVRCHAGEINQAVLNIVVNAAHAIGDVVQGTERRGTITVRTREIDGAAEIVVIDTGGGIPTHVRDRIFDPFFTTKPVGKGTGQGLAIARSVIVEKHGGQLSFESEPGKGTTFIIRLPIEAQRTEAA